jgi:hypothetical protein
MNAILIEEDEMETGRKWVILGRCYVHFNKPLIRLVYCNKRKDLVALKESKLTLKHLKREMQTLLSAVPLPGL